MGNLRDSDILMDFTVWLGNDIGLIGESPGFQLPEINIQTEEFRGGGMDGTVDVPMGIEKIEFDFDLHTYNTDVWAVLGYGPGSMNVPITFRGYMQTPLGIEKGVMVNTRCLVKSIKPGKVEPGKKYEKTISCTAHYYKHMVNGERITEIDVFNKVTFINGVDKSAQARFLLGF
jgi:P2 family phage contractile tail tube protein